MATIVGSYQVSGSGHSQVFISGHRDDVRAFKVACTNRITDAGNNGFGGYFVTDVNPEDFGVKIRVAVSPPDDNSEFQLREDEQRINLTPKYHGPQQLTPKEKAQLARLCRGCTHLKKVVTNNGDHWECGATRSIYKVLDTVLGHPFFSECPLNK